MELVHELIDYFKTRRKFWLAPILLFLFAFGGLILLTQGTAVAPFVYTLF